MNNDPTITGRLMWIPTAGLELASSEFANPVMVKGNLVGGNEKLLLQLINCDPEHPFIIASKGISIASSPDPFGSYSISSTVCLDSANLGSGLLTIIDSNNIPLTGIDDCDWSASPVGSATLSPQADKVTCKVTNAKSAFTVNVQLHKGKCISPQSYSITAQNCMP